MGAHSADSTQPEVEHLPHCIVAADSHLPLYTMMTFFVQCHI